MLFKSVLKKGTLGLPDLFQRFFLAQKYKKLTKNFEHNHQGVIRTNSFPVLKSENGKHVCNGCGICPKICPTQCLSLVMKGEKPQSLSLNWNRCIQCSLCVDLCPTQALTHEHLLSSSSLDGKPLDLEIDLIWLTKLKN